MSVKRNKFTYYKPKNYSNPFFYGKKHNSGKIINWKFRIVFPSSIIFVAALVWFIFFSGVFRIKNVIVEGANRTPVGEIENLVWRMTQNKRFIIGRQSNIFLFSDAQLKNLMNENYSFDGIAIKKKLFNTIIVSIKEKQPVAAWKEGNSYYLIDAEGNIVANAGSLDINQKETPLIENQGAPMVNYKKVDINGNEINYILKLFDIFKNNSDFPLSKFVVDSDINTVKVFLVRGPAIYFNVQGDINNQMNKLLTLYKGELRDNFNKQSYLDLRFGDRVYYK